MAIKSLLSRSHILKIPLFCIAFIVMMLARCGAGGDNLGWADAQPIPEDMSLVDIGNFVTVVGYGYVFILIVEIISIVAGEKWPVMNLLFSLCGFAFYIALGAMRIAFTVGGPFDQYKETKRALGSLAIINGVLFLIDAALAFIDRDRKNMF